MSFLTSGLIILLFGFIHLSIISFGQDLEFPQNTADLNLGFSPGCRNNSCNSEESSSEKITVAKAFLNRLFLTITLYQFGLA